MTGGRVAPFFVVGLYAVLYAVALAAIGLGAFVVTAVGAVTRPLRTSAGRGGDA